jgi:O-succinylhomoserine sulfhydrylase
MEGAEACVSVGSGMAAVFASMMSFLKTGDRVLANRVLFGSCHYIITQIMPRFGIAVELIDGKDNAAWKAALQTPAQAVFIESPANPTLELTDIATICSYAKRWDCKVIVDNIFATPLSQRPLEMGADMVIYSTTKYFDGQGRTLGGAILGKDKAFMEDVVLPFHRHTGPALSPFNAWVILKGLETLPLRWARHIENAQAIAQLLSKHSAVARVHYPTLPSSPQLALAKSQMLDGGALVAFELKGGKKAAFTFMNALELVLIANNLGDAKSLITHPATTTHSNLTEIERKHAGITDGLLRLSVGLESYADLERDLLKACEAR